jgi:hypothetical protein
MIMLLLLLHRIAWAKDAVPGHASGFLADQK